MPRVKTVEKCRKDQGKCGKCGDKIEKGMPYRYWQFFRQRGKNKRCMKSSCSPKASELTQSKWSGVYAAQEQAQDGLADWENGWADWDFKANGKPNVEDLKSVLEEAASEFRSVGEEYQESADNMAEHFEGSEKHQALEEAATGLEEFADNLESCLDNVSSEEPEEETVDSLQDWIDEVRSVVEDAIDGDLPEQPWY